MWTEKSIIWAEAVSQAWFDKFSKVVLSFGVSRYRVDHSIFYFTRFVASMVASVCG